MRRDEGDTFLVRAFNLGKRLVLASSYGRFQKPQEAWISETASFGKYEHGR